MSAGEMGAGYESEHSLDARKASPLIGNTFAFLLNESADVGVPVFKTAPTNQNLMSFSPRNEINCVVDYRGTFQAMLTGTGPMLALAPMQDVTDLPFWRLMARFGGADIYFTEYFRVYATSVLDRNILKSVTENPTGQPVIAQMIGNDIPSLVRTARELQQHPVAAIDLNLGCPAPVVYRKCAGGGLLREPKRVDAILGALRDAVSVKFTVKTRLGFDSTDVFEELLPILTIPSLDLLTVHGLTVKE